MVTRDSDLDQLAGASGADRLARIKALSDEQLSYYYTLLSDTRTVTNVPMLPMIEAEMRERGLPLGNTH